MFWILDGISFVCILVIGYNGFKNGLVEEMGRLLGLVIAILIAIANTSFLSSELHKILPLDNWLTKCFSFTFLFMTALILSRMLTKLVQITYVSKDNDLINKAMGFIFGSIKGAFMLVIFFWFVAILPIEKWKMIINQKSQIAFYSHQFRKSIVSFFNWEDPVSLSEAYIRQLTQP